MRREFGPSRVDDNLLVLSLYEFGRVEFLNSVLKNRFIFIKDVPHTVWVDGGEPPMYVRFERGPVRMEPRHTQVLSHTPESRCWC